MRSFAAVVALVALIAACDETNDAVGLDASAGAAGSGGKAGGGGGGAGASGIGGACGIGAVSGTGGYAGECTPAWKSLAPGMLLESGTDLGSGVCASTTVSGFLAKIHAAHPELGDIQQIYDVDLMQDGSFVYPFRKPDGSFAFVLKRGSGDCPSGCSDNEYWYFEADANCSPIDAGHFHALWTQDCMTLDGQARWGYPSEPDPASVCGADLTPQNISGCYQLWACGMWMECSLKGNSESLAGWVTVAIAQDAADPTKGSVTFSGLGYAPVDNVAFAATFIRRRFSVAFHQDNLPSSCPKSLDVSAGYDFEGFGMHSIQADQIDVADCDAGDYCKGGMSAYFFPNAP